MVIDSINLHYSTKKTLKQSKCSMNSLKPFSLVPLLDSYSGAGVGGAPDVMTMDDGDNDNADDPFSNARLFSFNQV